MEQKRSIPVVKGRGRRKRSLIIGFGSKRSYHRIQNDHDTDRKDSDHHLFVMIQRKKYKLPLVLI